MTSKRMIFLGLLVIAVSLSTFVSADTECTNEDCSVGFSLNVVGSPSSFFGFVKDLFNVPINGTLVEILGTNYSNITVAGFYNITQESFGAFDLKASKSGFLSQTKTNQLVAEGGAKQVDFDLSKVGGIGGNVVDLFTLLGVENANVTLKIYGLFLDSTLTDSNGNYSFGNLVPGYYEIIVTASEFLTNTRPDIHVLGGENTVVNFWMW